MDWDSLCCLPLQPSGGGHSFLTWVALAIHQFPDELLIDSAHLGTAATCSHCEVVKPRILGKTDDNQMLTWQEEGRQDLSLGRGCSSVTEHLSNVCETLGLIPTTPLQKGSLEVKMGMEGHTCNVIPGFRRLRQRAQDQPGLCETLPWGVGVC